MKHLNSIFILMGLVIPLFAGAQQTAPPVPTPLHAGVRVFLSNAGSDAGLFPHPFSGNPARAYVFFYQALKADGYFTIVNDPAKADLIFEVCLKAPYGPSNSDKTKGASDPLPTVWLTIYDRPTHVILWAFAEQVQEAELQKTHDKNFDDALHTVMTDLKQLENTASAYRPPRE